MTPPDPNVDVEAGVQLVACNECCPVGLSERIHGFACPHVE